MGCQGLNPGQQADTLHTVLSIALAPQGVSLKKYYLKGDHNAILSHDKNEQLTI